MVKGTKEETSSLEGHSAKYLADRWGFPYREPHTLSIDPSVLELLDREESKRLRVLPLEYGPDGPVFAVAEPSEERFAAVRTVAGDNASFVIVAKDTLDALLNSKVFGVPSSSRRPSLFGGRGNGDAAVESNHEGDGEANVELSQDGGEEPYGVEQANGAEPAAEHAEGAEGAEGAEQVDGSEHVNGTEHEHTHAHTFEGHGAENGAGPENGARSPDALDALLNQIAAGTGNLRAQVDQLTSSLEAAQRELREANEQLAEATRVNESHDELVNGLRAEVEGLKGELERSHALNASMTARLEDVARALTFPIGNDGDGDG